MSLTDAERRQRLRAAVDARLVDLWAMLWGPGPHALREVIEDEDGLAFLAAILGQAYVQGYQDALIEDRQGRRGELARAHGYAHH